jgi:hypothetical protein
MEKPPCFVFRGGLDSTDDRPVKRRKTGPGKTPTKQDSPSPIFVPLLDGAESAECVQLRHKGYKDLWTIEEQRINVRRYYSGVLLIAGCLTIALCWNVQRYMRFFKGDRLWIV